jgi:magnesium transporter
VNFRKRTPSPGSVPGSLVPPAGSPPPRIRVIEYGSDYFASREVASVEELARYRDPEHLTWIDVQGLGDVPLLRRLAELFSIHPLALEDAVNNPTRPKSDLYDSSHTVVARMVRFGDGGEVLIEQVTLFVGPRWLVSVQERHGDCLDPVRQRTQSAPLMRRHGIDYLAYAIVDTMIDNYFPVLEAVGEEIEAVESRLVEKPAPELVARIHAVRRQLIHLRRAIWPQRDAVSALAREESPFFTHDVRVFLRDTHDHVVQIADLLESYRDLAASLMELYLSSLSQRTNQVMQVLTVMASIFIPLTFVAGIYGMNFEHMPELRAPFGYPLALAGMAAIALGLLGYFWRRGWLSQPRIDEES